jgi:ParB family chromosome partitioning protein
LDALLPAADPAPVTPSTEGRGTLRLVPVEAVRPNPRQPRDRFDDGALESLAASIREVGVLQPILVQDRGDHFELIAGERRLRASRLADRMEIPALVRDADHQQSLEEALVENLHREDLNPLEEAAAYQQLIDDFGLTQELVAQRVGKSRSAVANTLRLLQLGPDVQRMLAEGALSAGHARTLLALADELDQLQLARQIVDEGWSVRQTEEAVRDELARAAAGEDPSPSTDPGATRPAAVLELEHLLADHLDTRVHVKVRGQRGAVVIDFATFDDLERIYRAMVHGPERD